ncbi:hypothetical protein EJB05_35594, partial [Eragrostis curvula]
MAGPSSGGFPWTPQYIERALDAIWRAVREHRDDHFRENNLAQAVSRLNATIPTTSHTMAPQHLTTNDLRALLEDQRQLYHRVCELANHPSVLGFSSTTFKIMMLPDQYASHVQVACQVHVEGDIPHPTVVFRSHLTQQHPVEETLQEDALRQHACNQTPTTMKTTISCPCHPKDLRLHSKTLTTRHLVNLFCENDPPTATSQRHLAHSHHPTPT